MAVQSLLCSAMWTFPVNRDSDSRRLVTLTLTLRELDRMKTSTTFCVGRRAAAVVCLVFALAWTAGTSWAQFTGLNAFGDSLSDLGNTYNALGGMGADQAIYGLSGYTASAGRYDDGRWSNGPLWLEHLGGQLGLPPLMRNNGMQPLTMGTDFAFGGSTTGTGYTDFILANLRTQV